MVVRAMAVGGSRGNPESSPQVPHSGPWQHEAQIGLIKIDLALKIERVCPTLSHTCYTLGCS